MTQIAHSSWNLIPKVLRPLAKSYFWNSKAPGLLWTNESRHQNKSRISGAYVILVGGFFPPIWKTCSLKWEIFPNFRVENSKNIWVATT